MEQLGMEFDYKDGVIRAPERKLKSLTASALDMIRGATRNKRWLHVRKLTRR